VASITCARSTWKERKILLDFSKAESGMQSSRQKKKRCMTGQKKKKQGVCHFVALPFTLKSIRQKQNYRNSRISPCQNRIFKEILYKKPKSFKIS
jgi:hypothetical protein